MDICKDLQCDGWYISEEGCKYLTDDGNLKNKKLIVENALNTDIKEFGSPILATQIKQNTSGKVILQIQKIRNISAPKSKEDSTAAPRMSKLTLTDGHTNCQAIELSPIFSISRTNTPPGAKLLINDAKVLSSCLLLNKDCCTLLGGTVPALFEKWEMAKTISTHTRTTGGPDGPPPWVNFGQKVVSSLPSEPFKSLTSKVTKETTNEFDTHRQDAIAEATTGAVKKVFGGGNKTIQESQENRRRYNKNFDNKNPESFRDRRGKREPREKMAEKQQKPAEKISLFDFLENKLVVNEVDDSTKAIDGYSYKGEAYRSNTSIKEPVKNWDQGSGYGGYKNRNMNKPKSYGGYNYYSESRPNFTNTSRSNDTTVANGHIGNSVQPMSKTFEHMSINSQFASRSLEQHLNLGNNRNTPENSTTKGNSGWNWKVGDHCMAKYWEDKKYYNAIIIDLTERTCVVQFSGYGNVEEVLKEDCLPFTEFNDTPNSKQRDSAGFRNKRHFTRNKAV